MENMFRVLEIDVVSGRIIREPGFMFANEAEAYANLMSQQRDDRAYWVKSWYDQNISGYGMLRLSDAARAVLSGLSELSEDRCI